MPLFDSLRRRLSHRLESHHIEEDYSPRESRVHSRSNSVVFNENIRYERNTFATNRIAEFDPTEDVPSYEISQLMYEQQGNGSNIILPGRGVQRQGSSNHLNYIEGYTPTSTSANVSRQNSVIAGSNTDLPSNGLSPSPKNNNKTLKSLGLQFLNARQHLALAFCRDLSLIPSFLGLIQAWRRAFYDYDIINSTSITSAKLPEHFLTGVWCIVAGYLAYSVLDGLMIRWIVTYLTTAAILRMLSMSTIIVTIEQYIVSTLSADGYKYGLHIWILISCVLTFVYILQNFVTLNLDLKGKRRARFFDFYNIVVFAVVPVGLASFVTMIGLLRSLLIVRIDIENALLSR